ncbi:unnamed protein product [Arabidopsis thaliana]|uniref:(thale cress) hypothetical protein n=1 Tax=Arabidopsis thaliana TaxID=3702 RepID=A0A7G2FIF8_ARATH|nr:unnamed protein product [Arabidopsis thaliana]
MSTEYVQVEIITSGRVLDAYRRSLTPYMVEVLLCTQ